MSCFRLFTFTIAALLLSACASSESEQVEFVKRNKLALCPGASVERMVEGFMRSPSWEAGNDGSVDFVNVHGEITYHERTVQAVIQFLVDLDAASFEYNAIAFDAVPQASLVAAGLLTRMCETVEGLILPEKT